MDIKTRIEGLTEQEAKAALKWVLMYVADKKFPAPCYMYAQLQHRVMKELLDKALKKGGR